jgi:hypothetical protein
MERLGLKPREFAQAVGISPWSLYALWRKGKGPPFRTIAGHRIIEVEAGRRWLQEEAKEEALRAIAKHEDPDTKGI